MSLKCTCLFMIICIITVDTDAVKINLNVNVTAGKHSSKANFIKSHDISGTDSLKNKNSVDTVGKAHQSQNRAMKTKFFLFVKHIC